MDNHDTELHSFVLAEVKTVVTQTIVGVVTTTETKREYKIFCTKCGQEKLLGK